MTAQGSIGHRADPLELPTPYIEVDAARLDRNLKRMQAKADAAGVRLRPHVKTHKSVAIARRQVELGASGITVSKPSEAEVFLDAGFDNILLAYPVVDPVRVDAMLEKGRGRSLIFIADSIEGVSALAAAAARHDCVLPVQLKVDVGLGRVGVLVSSPEALVVSRAIAGARNLRFAGLLSHAGHAYAAANPSGIESIARQEADDLSALSDRLRETGIVVPAISTGSTPTAVGSPLWSGSTEVRPGNYAFFDMTAIRLGLASTDDLALSVIARVVSVNDRFAIFDAGSKTLSSDRGPHGTGDGSFGLACPLSSAAPMRIDRLSEEHGFAIHNGVRPSIGSMLRIFPQHSCAVMALFDAYILREANGEVSTRPVDARGRVW